MMNQDQWFSLRGKRGLIESALHALGIPIVGWVNAVPMFKKGYKPDWGQIEKIATTLQVHDPKPIEKTKKPVKKTR